MNEGEGDVAGSRIDEDRTNSKYEEGFVERREDVLPVAHHSRKDAKPTDHLDQSPKNQGWDEQIDFFLWSLHV